MQKRSLFLILNLLSLLPLLWACGGKISSNGEIIDGINSGQHRIFVSSTDHDGNLGGVAGADAICATLATTAGLVKTYKAIISDSSVNAKERLLLLGSIVMVRANGNQVVVANTPDTLWDTDNTTLLSNVALDEYGSERVGVTPWTGTAASGVGSLNFCSDWASNSNLLDGDYGSTDSRGPTWLELSFEDCDQLNPIYCISVD